MLLLLIDPRRARILPSLAAWEGYIDRGDSPGAGRGGDDRGAYTKALRGGGGSGPRALSLGEAQNREGLASRKNGHREAFSRWLHELSWRPAPEGEERRRESMRLSADRLVELSWGGGYEGSRPGARAHAQKRDVKNRG